MIGLILLMALASQGDRGETEPTSQVTSKADIRIIPRCARGEEPSEEIVVCGTRSETERQRLPRIFSDRFDPNGQVDSVSRERHRLYEVGETGIGSCSNSGPGGMSGCDFKRFKQRLEQHGK